MPTPSSQRPWLCPAAWLFASALVACSGSQERALEQARERIENGDLASAERALHGLDSARADELRVQIEAAASHRVEVERSLARIRDGALQHEPNWLRKELAPLLKAEHDPVMIELIEQAQSDLTSLLAASRQPALRGAQRESSEIEAVGNLAASSALIDAASREGREGREAQPSPEDPSAAERSSRGVAASSPAATSRASHASSGARGAKPSALSPSASAADCSAIAESCASACEFSAARDAWLEAARRGPDLPWRAECERRAKECDLRLALREELADYARVDGETARLLGWNTAADDAGAPRFEALPLAELSRAIERARVSNKARMGWLIESIFRGDADERRLAVNELGPCVESGLIDADHASGLVARAKGDVAVGGWVFQNGRWIDGSLAKSESAAAADAVQAAKHAKLVGEFRRCTPLERDALLARLRTEGDRELLSQALGLRWQDDWDKLERNPNLRQLAALADERRALDRARKNALDLIFDELRYFYPYNPPECPPQKAARYAAVQREVDELVSAVRDVWERSKRVKISNGLREQLAMAVWTAEQAREASIELSPIPAESRFALVLPTSNDVSLAQFAWDAAERAALSENDRIEARNERLWAARAHAKAADDVPNADEQDQVRVTNEYRRMLGRRALAWNPMIEAAAQGHSDHMANSGDFSHSEQGDPARTTPFDRLRLAGYTKGVSENISMGRSDPKSAHEGWTQSSGHHRNLLMPDHREMASAIASNYWTQNFGVDSSFLADL